MLHAATTALFCILYVIALAQVLQSRRNGASFVPGLANLSLSLIIVMCSEPAVLLIATALCSAVALGGAAFDYWRRQPCNCLGVLENELRMYIQHIRIAIVLLCAAVAVLLQLNPDSNAKNALPLGSSIVIMAVLGLLVMRKAEAQGGGGTGAPLSGPAEVRKIVPAAAPQQLGDAIVGFDSIHRQLRISDLRLDGQALAILALSKGCAPCEILKVDVAALKPLITFPLWTVANQPASTLDEPNQLTNPDRSFQSEIGLLGDPALILFEASDGTTPRLVYGVDQIRAALVRLIAHPV